jgi:hypothetical protein
MPPVFGRLVALVLAVSTGGLITACGSTGGSTTPTSPRGATAKGAGRASAAPAIGRSPTRSQAVAFARGVNLSAADVPGFTVEKREREDETAAEKQLGHQLLHCAGALSARQKLIEVSSSKFTRGHSLPQVDVSSEVSVARTPGLAARELATIRSAHARTCVSRYLNLLFKGKAFRGARINPITIVAGTPPAPGTTGSFGWRIRVAFTVKSTPIPFYFDILGFVYGPAQVVLLSTGFPIPLPAAIQQRLFVLLVARAKANGAALSRAH